MTTRRIYTVLTPLHLNHHLLLVLLWSKLIVSSINHILWLQSLILLDIYSDFTVRPYTDVGHHQQIVVVDIKLLCVQSRLTLISSPHETLNSMLLLFHLLYTSLFRISSSLSIPHSFNHHSSISSSLYTLPSVPSSLFSFKSSSLISPSLFFLFLLHLLYTSSFSISSLSSSLYLILLILFH